MKRSNIYTVQWFSLTRPWNNLFTKLHCKIPHTSQKVANLNEIDDDDDTIKTKLQK